MVWPFEEVNFDILPTRVIVLSAADDDRDVIRAVRLGARGVVLKESAIDLLVKSIHSVHAGGISVDSYIAGEMVKAFSASSGGRNEKPLLTDREMEVAQLVGQGLQNRAIGKKLFISEQNVKNHMLNIFDKFGVYDRVELMLYAIHHGFIDKPDGP